MLDWERLKGDFVPDGALRDIYVLDASPGDWQRVVDWLRLVDPAPVYLVTGEPRALPARVEDIFVEWASGQPLLQFDVEGMQVNCHFFVEDEIEFDIDPAQVNSANLEGLGRLLSDVATAVGKPVLLTQEGWRQAVILRCEPGETTEAV